MVVEINNQSDSSAIIPDFGATEIKYMLEQLPFFPADNRYDPLFDSSVNELLLDGYTNQKTAQDGFLGFHHLKYTTSNAKQIARLFSMSMGFQEIAYRGLETGSRVVSSHVVKNGQIIIEFISPLKACDENPSMLPATYETWSQTTAQILEDKLISINNQMFAMVEKVIGNSLEESLVINEDKKQQILNQIRSTSQYGGMMKLFERLTADVSQYSTLTIHDLMDSFLISNYLTYHGEGVMDMSFEVVDVDRIFDKAVKAGAVVIKTPKVFFDQYGSMKLATVGIPDTDIHHTLVENINYQGSYLPGYIDPVEECADTGNTPVMLYTIDHCVENYSWNQMITQAKLYAKMFGFHKFWSVDDTEIATENSSLNSFVVASSNGKIKMPINEPSEGKMKGQIEEFNDFNGGPGIQHIAMRTFNIIDTVSSMKANGVKFNEISSKYYETLSRRLQHDDIRLIEDFETLRKLNILVDYDVTTRNPKTKVCAYLLQIFTKPLGDRPTIFLEIIQRHHHQGFGKGTFKALYQSIELEQFKRGNLVPSTRTT